MGVVTELERFLAVAAAALVVGLLMMAAVGLVSYHEAPDRTDADTVILQPAPPAADTVRVYLQTTPPVFARPDLHEHYGAYVVEDALGLYSCFPHDVWYPGE